MVSAPYDWKYNIVMDVDRERVFNSGLDVVDSVLVTGFFVVPEVPIVILAIMSSVIAIKKKLSP